MTGPKVLALVLAAGRDPHPVTSSCARSSLSLGGYRLVDFALSNLVNSGVESIYVLAGEDADILERHVRDQWVFSGSKRDRFVRVVQTVRGQERGGVDIVGVLLRNIHLIGQHDPDLVAIFNADQVCRMDVRQMVSYHHEHGAEVTVAAAPVLVTQASQHDVIVAGCNGEVWHVQERPDFPTPIPFDPGYAYAAMGNVLFNADALIESLKEVAQRGGRDVGQGLLPHVVRAREVFAYDFSVNRVPGAHCAEESYWRNISTLQAYIDATQDIDGPVPRLRLDNPYWPMLPLQAAVEDEAGMKLDAWLPEISMPQFENRLVYH